MTAGDDYLELKLDDDYIKAEFRVACQQAIENNEIEFPFYGYVVNTSDAIDVVLAMDNMVTYH